MSELISFLDAVFPSWVTRIGMGLLIFLSFFILTRRNYQKLSTKLITLYGDRRDYIVKQTYRMFIELKPRTVMMYQLAGTAFMFFAAFVLTWPHPYIGFPLGMALTVLVLQGPRVILDSMVTSRIRKFTLQLIDALTLMANALRSGLNVPQALQIVSEEMPNPVAQEFGLVLREQKVGVSLEDALTSLNDRLPSDEVDIFVTSVNILRETGGNLAETFDTITHTLRERVKLEQKISAMVAQGVVQGTIMVLLPFGIAIMLYMINPAQMRLMFTTPMGWGIIAFMVFLQSIGAFAIWKIINIKV